MTTYTAFEVSSGGSDFVKVDKEVQEPPPGFVRVKVYACGLCHSDCFTKLGIWPGLQFPRSPGHEVAGVVDAVGAGVGKWKAGDRVGVGWYGGHCTECESCREADLINCDKMPVTGINYDGGYGQYVVADAKALAAIPDSLSFVEAAPLMCAGVTVFNGLRQVKALAGSTVGVQGIGGLGHLAIQYANKMGYKVVVFSRGEEKKAKAMELGAHHYIDTTSADVVEKAQALGGIKVLLATSTSPQAMSQVLPTLAKNSTMVILGAGAESINVDPIFLIGGARSIKGHPSGIANDSEDALKFAALSGVRSMNEVYPASKTPEAYDRMMSGKAMFRVVIDWEKSE